MKAVIQEITEVVKQSLHPFESVGEVLLSQYPAAAPDGARPAIWVVPGVHCVADRAYVPMALDADRITPIQVAGAINKTVQTDLLIMFPGHRAWYFVLCGKGWTDDLVGEIKCHTRTHFTDNQIDVVTFASLAWLDKRIRISVTVDVSVPGVYDVAFDHRTAIARRVSEEPMHRAPVSTCVLIDTNQDPPRVDFFPGDSYFPDISEAQYEEEARKRVLGSVR